MEIILIRIIKSKLIMKTRKKSWPAPVASCLILPYSARVVWAETKFHWVHQLFFNLAAAMMAQIIRAAQAVKGTQKRVWARLQL
jgi:hypothetical protein